MHLVQYITFSEDSVRNNQIQTPLFITCTFLEFVLRKSYQLYTTVHNTGKNCSLSLCKLSVSHYKVSLAEFSQQVMWFGLHQGSTKQPVARFVKSAHMRQYNFKNQKNTINVV